jgi:hypothetical protein
MLDTVRKGSISGTGDDAQMADQVRDAFIAFARSGDPNTKSIPTWEHYELPRRQTVMFNTSAKLVADSRGGERQLFAKVPYIQQGLDHERSRTGPNNDLAPTRAPNDYCPLRWCKGLAAQADREPTNSVICQ